MKAFVSFALMFLLTFAAAGQVSMKTMVTIVKAEDERRFDATLESLMKSPNVAVRERAALAAGRIGDDAAIPALAALISADKSDAVRAMAMFAVGEIESIKGADIVLASREIKNEDLRARAVEAAGKIAAANAKDPKASDLKKMIAEALYFETARRSMPNRDVIILGLTAALRTRPEGVAETIATFLGYSDEQVRADAGNALTRLRAKVGLAELRKMVKGDTYAIARANAARALGAAEDKDSIEVLLEAAIGDQDQRVRVSAIRALAGLKDPSVAQKLTLRGNTLLSEYRKSKFSNPVEKNELLEIATTLGRLLQGTEDATALDLLQEFRKADKFVSPETEIAFVRISPSAYFEALAGDPQNAFGPDWHSSSAAFQALGEVASLPANDKNDALKLRTKLALLEFIRGWSGGAKDQKIDKDAGMAIPDLLRAYAGFKSETTSDVIRPLLETESDIVIRATVADILGDQKPSKDNIAALQKAFTQSMIRDKAANDATLSIMDALFRLDKGESAGTLLTALNSFDYLVRKKAFELLHDPDLQKQKPGIPTMIESALAKKKDQVSRPSVAGTLGVINSSPADYLRAVSRKNGSVMAVVTTEKGDFTINFMPEEAPLTVDNFIKLARSGYFNGLAVHRVVPNFVMQDGDNRGDGNGGPPWSIRCEVNTLPYERGAVGMALSGKDTGGSQWFVTHSRQPHLDGGYTVFGRVNESDMKVVDSIVRGDRILKIKIVGK